MIGRTAAAAARKQTVGGQPAQIHAQMSSLARDVSGAPARALPPRMPWLSTEEVTRELSSVVGLLRDEVLPAWAGLVMNC